MALASATITFDVADLLGNDFDARRIKAWTTTNADNNRLIDTAANKVRMGDGVATVGTDGTGSFSVWVPGPDGNPTSWQQTFWFDYPLPGGRGREVKPFGPYTITGNADIADLEQQQAIPPTYLSQVAGALSDYVDDAQEAQAGAESARSGAETARDEAIDISGISTSDDVVEALVKPGAAGPKTKAALSASTAAPQRAALLSRAYKAATGQFVIALFGMSITSFGVTPMKIVLAKLRAIYGDVGALHERFGVSGGDFAANNGMEKQPYGGPFYVRGRMSPSSSPRFIPFFGDTLWLQFSREADSVPCNVYVDGVLWGTSTSSGSQLYRRRVSGAALSRGPHVVRIDPPASGFAYLEDLIAFDSTRRGIVYLDYTIGGSLWKNMTTLSSFGSVTGITIAGDNGVNAHFGTDEYDLPIIGQDVNDIADPATVMTLLDKAIALVDTRGVQMGLISSMGGVMVNPADGRHAGYEAIRTAYRTRSTARSDIITYFPWQDAVQLPDDRYDEFQARYYAPGDGIHPGNITDGYEGSPIGTALFSRILGIPTPAQFSETAVIEENERRPALPPPPKPLLLPTTRYVATGFAYDQPTATMTFNRTHNLEVGDVIRMRYYGDETFTVTGITSRTAVTITAPPFGSATDPNTPVYANGVLRTTEPIGYGQLFYAEGGEPSSFHATPAGNWDLDTTAAIAASSSTDRWGRYKTFSNNAVEFRVPSATVLTWSFLIGGDAVWSITKPTTGFLCAPDGTIAYNDGQGYSGARVEAGSTSEPRFVAVHFRITTPTGSAPREIFGAMNLTGKIYASHLSVGTLPTLGVPQPTT